TLIVVLAGGVFSGGGAAHPKARVAAKPVRPAAGPARLVVGMASWRLPAPTSRAVAFPIEGNIDVLGGLTGGGDSTTGDVVQIDPTTGKSEQVATLPAPVHDAP